MRALARMRSQRRRGRATLVARLAPNADLVIAVDGGGVVCLEGGVTPDVLVGDLDSADSETVDTAARARRPSPPLPAEKDATDLELAIAEARAQGADEIVVTAATSGRLDHTLAALAALAAAADLRPRDRRARPLGMAARPSRAEGADASRRRVQLSRSSRGAESRSSRRVAFAGRSTTPRLGPEIDARASATWSASSDGATIRAPPGGRCSCSRFVVRFRPLSALADNALPHRAYTAEHDKVLGRLGSESHEPIDTNSRYGRLLSRPRSAAPLAALAQSELLAILAAACATFAVVVGFSGPVRCRPSSQLSAAVSSATTPRRRPRSTYSTCPRPVVFESSDFRAASLPPSPRHRQRASTSRPDQLGRARLSHAHVPRSRPRLPVGSEPREVVESLCSRPHAPRDSPSPPTCGSRTRQPTRSGSSKRRARPGPTPVPVSMTSGSARLGARGRRRRTSGRSSRPPGDSASRAPVALRGAARRVGPARRRRRRLRGRDRA